MPKCDHNTTQYLEITTEFLKMGEKQLMMKTGCMTPCRYDSVTSLNVF